MSSTVADDFKSRASWWPWGAVVVAMLLGLGLLADSAWSSSATYDEVAYLRVGTHWWRTGKSIRITRMGSPLLFWKLQQAPTLWLLDHTGHSDWIDDPIVHQADLLPRIRVGTFWIWVAGLIASALWAREMYGPRAMAFTAWLYCLSPNILAHGGLATMETPILATAAAAFYLAWRFLAKDSRAGFWWSAVVCGFAFSCKFTAILFPILIALAWLADAPLSWKRLRTIAIGMSAFIGVMLVTDFILTGFALLPISQGQPGRPPDLSGRLHPFLAGLMATVTEIPIPQDWVGFLKQLRHQWSGGSSYLLGVRRMQGWRFYYFVAMAVKIPLTFWALLVIRSMIRPVSPHSRMLLVIVFGFLAITAVGSSRNYGIRYLLPISPVALVWVSGIVKCGRWRRNLALLALGGQALAVGLIHPHELTYFNEIAGGPVGGRRILADSNLDWGQGLKSLVRLQTAHPEYRDLTLYYFGDTDPILYGVAGKCHVIDAIGGRPGLPPRPVATTRYLAVSASIQWGPWGPDGYFRRLAGVRPIAFTDDKTIAIYRSSDLKTQ